MSLLCFRTNILGVFLFFPAISLFAQYAKMVPPENLQAEGAQLEDSIEVIESTQAPLVKFKLNDLSLKTRYRVENNIFGEKTHDLVQLRLNIDWSLSFFHDPDDESELRIDFQAGTGNSFSGSYSNTGIGDRDENLELHLRRLAVFARMNQSVELGAGSMDIKYGAGSEDTYFDKDGYLSGFRGQLNLDDTEAILTAGYVGDFSKPNFFERADRFVEELNYVQALVYQEFNETVAASIDYSFIGKSDDVEHDNQVGRLALRINTAHMTDNLVDSIRMEYAKGFVAGEDNFDLFSVGVYSNFKEEEGFLISDALGGRNLKCSVRYLYRSEDDKDLDFPIEDKPYSGSSYRVGLELQDLLKGKGPGRSSLGLDWTQSIDDPEAWRCELILGWAF